MKNKVLVTGGAGFIGSFIVDSLINEGHEVRIFDSLEPQVHTKGMPKYVNREAEFIKGDVLDYDSLKEAVRGVDVIFHKAAMVGVGQSMYQIKRYTEVNSIGTANLLDIAVNGNRDVDVKKIILASSMSTYGEGAYECDDHGTVYPAHRKESDMKKGDFEIHCPHCGKICSPKPTPEEKVQDCTSVYAVSKKNQEELAMVTGRAFGIPVTSLRYFNVFGPRQSLSNPYTGVSAIFTSSIMNNSTPYIFEDGNQSRDFISVHDIAKANSLCMSQNSANGEVFNVGTGNRISIKRVAETIAEIHGKKIKPEITGKFRKGDIRHCYADISKIRSKLGFNPEISFESGMRELAEWSGKEEAKDMSEKALHELRKMKLSD